VAESFCGGAVVSEVARRHDISLQHLTAWLKAAGAGLRACRPTMTSTHRLSGALKCDGFFGFVLP
jgi:transposase-like protein